METNPFFELEQKFNQKFNHIETLIDGLKTEIEKTAQPIQENPITASELAGILHTTVENIHRQKAKGKIPFKKMGGRTYFLLSDVVDAMRPGRVIASDTQVIALFEKAYNGTPEEKKQAEKELREILDNRNDQKERK